MAGQTGEANGSAMLEFFCRSLKIAGIGLLALGVQVQALEAQGSPGPDAHSCTPGASAGRDAPNPRDREPVLLKINIP